MITRLATGVLAALVFLVAIFVPIPLVFTFAAGAVLILGGREWGKLCGFNTTTQWLYIGFLILTYLYLVFFGSGSKVLLLILTTLAVVFWLLAIPILALYPKYQSIFRHEWPVAVLGAIFMLSTSAGLVWLKELPNGEWRVTLIVGLVAVADTCAYLAGKRFGKHKLAQDISPAKTVEGAIGGFLGNLLLATLVVLVLDLTLLSNLLVYLLILAANMLSIVGDLTESLIKRNRGVKDSGDLLPGHGGVLDRIDGLLAATPLFVLATLLFSPLS